MRGQALGHRSMGWRALAVTALVVGTLVVGVTANSHQAGGSPPSTSSTTATVGSTTGTSTTSDAGTTAGPEVPGSSGSPSATGTSVDPAGVAVSGGNLYVADPFDNLVREVESTGTDTVIAGDGTSGYSGDGGPATAAELASPTGVAVDGSGNVVVADTGNARLRVVTEHTGTFYGVSMTAGDIYTVAGGKAVRSGAHRAPTTTTTTPTTTTTTTTTVSVAAAGQDAMAFGTYDLAGGGQATMELAETLMAPADYLGDIQITSTDQWWLVGDLSSYTTTGTQGILRGTGTLSWWDPTADSGHGAWAPAKIGITYQVTVTLTTGSVPGTFGITFYGAPTPPPSISSPNSTPVPLTSGQVSLS